MASENAEKGTSGGYSSGVDHSTTGSTSSNSNGEESQSLFGALFGGLFGRKTATATKRDTALPAPIEERNYQTKYPQWRGVTRVASQISGVAESYFDRLMGVESSGNPNAKSPLSTASGLFQFTKGTAKDYGLKNPFDPAQSAVAVGKLTRDNYRELTKSLGRAPSQGELYMAHQQGIKGAKSLLSADRNARAADIVGTKAVTNQGLSRNATVGQLVGKFTSKFDGKGRTAATRGGSAVQQDTNNDVSSFHSKIVDGVDIGFWSAALGIDEEDQAQIVDTVHSLQNNAGGSVDPFVTGSISDSTGTETLIGSAGTDTFSVSNFTDVMGKVLSGDVQGAVNSFAGTMFGTASDALLAVPKFLFGDALGLEPSAVQTAVEGTAAGSVFDTIQEYFLRIIVIVLGIVFVAVGLAMFKPAQDAVKTVVKVVK